MNMHPKIYSAAYFKLQKASPGGWDTGRGGIGLSSRGILDPTCSETKTKRNEHLIQQVITAHHLTIDIHYHDTINCPLNAE